MVIKLMSTSVVMLYTERVAVETFLTPFAQTSKLTKNKTSTLFRQLFSPFLRRFCSIFALFYKLPLASRVEIGILL